MKEYIMNLVKKKGVAINIKEIREFLKGTCSKQLKEKMKVVVENQISLKVNYPE